MGYIWLLSDKNYTFETAGWVAKRNVDCLAIDVWTTSLIENFKIRIVLSYIIAMSFCFYSFSLSSFFRSSNCTKHTHFIHFIWFFHFLFQHMSKNSCVAPLGWCCCCCRSCCCYYCCFRVAAIKSIRGTLPVVYAENVNMHTCILVSRGHIVC